MALQPMATGNVFEITYKGKHLTTGCEIINRNHYLVTNTPGTPTDTIEDFTEEASLNWVTNVVPLLSDDYFLMQTVGQKVVSMGVHAPGDRPQTTTVYGEGWTDFTTATGGVAKPSLPAFCTVSCRLKCGNPSRYYRGGVRLGPIAVSQQAAVGKDLLLGASLTLWSAGMAAYRNTLVGLGLSVAALVVFSKVHATYETPLLPLDASCELVLQTEVNAWFRSQLTRQAPHIP